MKLHSLSLLALTILIALLSISMTYQEATDSDYRTAISLGEKKFESLKVKRDSYKLIKIENDMLRDRGESWKLTFLSKGCISEDGQKDCLGGDIFINVNIKTQKASVTWGE